MRTAIIIPARLEARRLPNKPLALLGGVPLVIKVAQQAQRCPGVDMVCIASDAAAICTAAAQHGVQALLTAARHRSGTARVAEAAQRLEAEFICNVQGDEPFVHPNDLQALLGCLQTNNYDMVTLKRPLQLPDELHDPHVVKVVSRDDGQALYFSRAAIAPPQPAANASHSAATAFAHVGVYGYTRAALERWQQAGEHALEQTEGLEQLRALAIGMRCMVLPGKTRGRGIDTPADLAWACQQVARLGEAAFPNFVPPTSPRRVAADARLATYDA